ncbi:hypothetical protein P3538_01670 [Vibrio parahaemolyticus]|uniref:hypothetical protein n=2 Tax=Vibrio parahaemolyticus TaxID=670 RepID=UPI001120112E|nr:hypothetical protein [Vibrio parahaemolyticus]MDF4673154.1 hypothetical protein [Vibrio parahaemolyticus]MDF4697404.1 hypothetical protein [Vibrio parahaemolyticus]TOK92542.1 hypothetical protein CGI08_08410 [Vibrio parahaemolyticus]TON12877.1 hypothetical protein CGH63_04465 [Vibrio parahaemolyticus]TOO29587.1 hypothetical protein CGH39_24400 [Vibrio parahaemolyticus]
MNYRNISRSHVKAAREELNSGCDKRLHYAALELRMAMEAITYDRALAYKREFPPEEYETWQPKKVMMVLLEIDAHADVSSTISFGVQPSPDTPPEEMVCLGTEKTFNFNMLKKHYDALGNYLHIISMKRFKERKFHDATKLRSRCEEISEFLEQALSSPVFNMTFGNFSSLDCFECQSKIRKRIPDDFSEPITATCFDCRATYILTKGDEAKIRWELKQHEIKCGNLECQRTQTVLERDIKLGESWICSSCNGQNTFALGIHYNKAIT